MDARLQEIIDHHEIRKLLAEYCNACDRCDEPRMAAVYCKDSWDNHGRFSGNGVDFAHHTMQGMRENSSCSHLLGQSIIRVDGDTAGVETYFLAVIRSGGKDGDVEMVHQLGGRYVDRLAREDGVWKIKDRTAMRDWSITLPRSQDWIGTQGLTEGRRTNKDLCFGALGFDHSGVPDFSWQEA